MTSKLVSDSIPNLSCLNVSTPKLHPQPLRNPILNLFFSQCRAKASTEFQSLVPLMESPRSARSQGEGSAEVTYPQRVRHM